MEEDLYYREFVRDVELAGDMLCALLAGKMEGGLDTVRPLLIALRIGAKRFGDRQLKRSTEHALALLGTLPFNPESRSRLVQQLYAIADYGAVAVRSERRRPGQLIPYGAI